MKCKTFWFCRKNKTFSTFSGNPLSTCFSPSSLLYPHQPSQLFECRLSGSHQSRQNLLSSYRILPFSSLRCQFSISYLSFSLHQSLVLLSIHCPWSFTFYFVHFFPCWLLTCFSLYWSLILGSSIILYLIPFLSTAVNSHVTFEALSHKKTASVRRFSRLSPCGFRYVCNQVIKLLTLF